MSEDNGYIYGFTQFSRAWYADACGLKGDTADEIMVGRYAIEGGCAWEFGIRWIRLPEPTPRVEVFGDAWQSFAEVLLLFAELAERDSLSPVECCELLKRLGFEDVTKEKSPFKETSADNVDPVDALREILPYAENELASLCDTQRRDGGLEREVAACEAKVNVARRALEKAA